MYDVYDVLDRWPEVYDNQVKYVVTEKLGLKLNISLQNHCIILITMGVILRLVALFILIKFNKTTY